MTVWISFLGYQTVYFIFLHAISIALAFINNIRRIILLRIQEWIEAWVSELAGMAILGLLWYIISQNFV
jgi:hypothetical protein